jgi:hypothetical protein
MSTKIYEAYKIPVARLVEWQEFFNNGCRKYIIGRLRKCEVPKEEADKFRSRRKEFRGDKWEWSDKEISISWGFSRWMLESKSGRIGAFNFDSSFNFWIKDGMAYIIPYWPCGMKARVPDWCEEYRYWNNCDHPENISYEEWEERGEVWEDLALEDWDKGRMCHVAFEGKKDYFWGIVGIRGLMDVFSGGDEVVRDRIGCGVSEFICMEVERQGK